MRASVGANYDNSVKYPVPGGFSPEKKMPRSAGHKIAAEGYNGLLENFALFLLLVACHIDS